MSHTCVNTRSKGERPRGIGRAEGVIKELPNPTQAVITEHFTHANLLLHSFLTHGLVICARFAVSRLRLLHLVVGETALVHDGSDWHAGWNCAEVSSCVLKYDLIP